MKAKIKYRLIKYIGIASTFLLFLGISMLFTACGAYELWKNISENGIEDFVQWSSLVGYRLCVYLIPPLFLSAFVFDKRFKWINRFLIWLNWCLFLYIIAKALIIFFAIDKLVNFEGFMSTLDSFVILAGYVFTFIKKEKIEFDSSGAIIDRDSFKEKIFRNKGSKNCG